MDGVYSMTYRGIAGWGGGMLVLLKGTVTGADSDGGLYDGTYQETRDDLILQLTMTVPAGMPLVQGVPPRSTQYTVPFHATVPKRSIEDSSPVLIDLPPGPVNVIVKRLRALS